MIAITAGAAGSLLANRVDARGLMPAQKPMIWRGIALGAEAQIILYNDDRDKAGAILERCRREISRLENLFSLYRPDSQLVHLNRNGALTNPDFEMLEILSRSKAIGRETAGAFDITVQPLWRLYADYFSVPKPAGSRPDPASIEKTLELVDYRRIDLASHKIELSRKGMAITLNGIAQGYMTDRIACLLRRSGWANVLINLGELYAMGRKPGGKTWTAGIAALAGGGNAIKRQSLLNQALATSGGYGTMFSTDGKHHHLFDPRTGRSTDNYQSVSVVARDATTADALSTAFSAMPLSDIERVLPNFPGAAAIIVRANNEIVEI